MRSLLLAHMMRRWKRKTCLFNTPAPRAAEYYAEGTPPDHSECSKTQVPAPIIELSDRLL